VLCADRLVSFSTQTGEIGRADQAAAAPPYSLTLADGKIVAIHGNSLVIAISHGGAAARVQGGRGRRPTVNRPAPLTHAHPNDRNRRVACSPASAPILLPDRVRGAPSDLGCRAPRNSANSIHAARGTSGEDDARRPLRLVLKANPDKAAQGMTVLEHASVCTLDCPDTCSPTVEVEGDRIPKVRGSGALPYTDGIICKKVARHSAEFIHDAIRLHWPLRCPGPRGSGRAQLVDRLRLAP
jgi:hypothetical protein